MKFFTNLFNSWYYRNIDVLIEIFIRHNLSFYINLLQIQMHKNIELLSILSR